jgi:hypothetical protein
MYSSSFSAELVRAGYPEDRAGTQKMDSRYFAYAKSIMTRGNTERQKNPTYTQTQKTVASYRRAAFLHSAF